MRSTKTFVGFALLTVAAMFTQISDRNHTLAAEFSCKSSQCPNNSKCEGDHWLRSECAITCYRETGTPGEIIFSGSANCGTGEGGRAIGDGPGSL